MNLIHLGSQISSHDMQMAYYLTSITHIYVFKYILYDIMLIRSYPGKVGHDLDLKISF